jgi:hypothetical protein
VQEWVPPPQALVLQEPLLQEPLRPWPPQEPLLLLPRQPLQE